MLTYKSNNIYLNHFLSICLKLDKTTLVPPSHAFKIFISRLLTRILQKNYAYVAKVSIWLKGLGGERKRGRGRGAGSEVGGLLVYSLSTGLTRLYTRHRRGPPPPPRSRAREERNADSVSSTFCSGRGICF